MLDYPCIKFNSSLQIIWIWPAERKTILEYMDAGGPQKGWSPSSQMPNPRREWIKKKSPKELINGHLFQSDSYPTPAYVTIMDLLTLKQCYSNRYQNILIWWNAGWNIIATSQQTETSWDNCTAMEKRLSLQMPLKALSFVF